MYTMTVSQLERALNNNRYILLDLDWGSCGYMMGINCKIAKLKSMLASRRLRHGNSLTDFHGFRACSFQEYITHKNSFV